MTPAEVARAIDTIEDHRQIHVDWCDYLLRHPTAATKPRPQVDVAGDQHHHAGCIRRYDQVLTVLRWAKDLSERQPAAAGVEQ